MGGGVRSSPPSMRAKTQRTHRRGANTDLFIVRIQNDDAKQDARQLGRSIIKQLTPLDVSRPILWGDEDTNDVQILFHAYTAVAAEMSLQMLESLGIGQGRGSSISIVPALTKQRGTDDDDDEEADQDKQQKESTVKDIENRTSAPLRKKKNRFVDTIKNREALHQIVRFVNVQSVFSFDFVMLTLVASTLAGIGLATDNAVIIVASMLVSPIMGPVLALTFGTMIGDRKMVRNALAVEILALCICIGVGFIVGILFTPFSSTLGWPTEEMTNRANYSGLLIGIAIALPSGIGVGLSVLGNRMNSLVGVAISASLLPPAVDTGLLWAFALFTEHETLTSSHIFGLGTIAFLLTVLNIGFIYLTSLMMFKIKGVSPTNGNSYPIKQKHKATLSDHLDAPMVDVIGFENIVSSSIQPTSPRHVRPVLVASV